MASRSLENRPVVYEIDEENFSSLDGFFEEVSRALIPGAAWGRNLDAFNDILRGGFGTPEPGFTLRWTNHELSRERLGYPETVRFLESMLESCHPSNRESVAARLERARAGQGQTVFELLVEIISKHGPGGTEAEDNVRLELA